jgi:hypothetical protein
MEINGSCVAVATSEIWYFSYYKRKINQTLWQYWTYKWLQFLTVQIRTINRGSMVCIMIFESLIHCILNIWKTCLQHIYKSNANFVLFKYVSKNNIHIYFCLTMFVFIMIVPWLMIYVLRVLYYDYIYVNKNISIYL